MSKKTTKKKGEIPTMIFKSEKSKNYIYTLKNGTTLEFQNKDFPRQETQTNQLTMF